MAGNKRRKPRKKLNMKKGLLQAGWIPCLAKFSNMPEVKIEIFKFRKYYNNICEDIVIETMNIFTELCDKVREKGICNYYKDERVKDDIYTYIDLMLVDEEMKGVDKRISREETLMKTSNILLGAKANKNGRIENMSNIIFNDIVEKNMEECVSAKYMVGEYPNLVVHELINMLYKEFFMKLERLELMLSEILFDGMKEVSSSILDNRKIYGSISDMYKDIVSLLGTTKKERILEYLRANDTIDVVCNSMVDYIDIIMPTLERLRKENKVEKISKYKVENVFRDRTYKELNTLATDKGYKRSRTTGDHGIYKNTNGDLLIIPQGRVIGKGLQRIITKQLKVD